MWVIEMIKRVWAFLLALALALGLSACGGPAAQPPLSTPSAPAVQEPSGAPETSPAETQQPADPAPEASEEASSAPGQEPPEESAPTVAEDGWYSSKEEVALYKQGEAAKAGYVFVPVLVAGGKVIEDKGKIRHAHGNLFLHEGIGDTPGKIALACADFSPQNHSVVSVLYLLPLFHIGTGFHHLGAFAVVVPKRPFPHSRVGEALSFQPFHFLPVLLLPVCGFQHFPAFPLAVTFFGVSVTSENRLALREVGFFGLAAAPAI